MKRVTAVGSKLVTLASAGFILSVSISILAAPPASALIGELKETLDQKLKWLVGDEEPAPAKQSTPPPSNSSSQPDQQGGSSSAAPSASQSEPGGAGQVNPAEPAPITTSLPPPLSDAPKLKGTVAGVSTVGYTPDAVNLGIRGGAPGAAAVPFEVIYPSSQGWVILGLAWYWWLAGLASAALVAQAVRRYYQPEQSPKGIRAIKS